ncbi:Uncharacterised protein [Mycobacteroides abscessus subsp. abscessus]|uniref:hypothetical protein n=1 Tax=Mycobacteroides abscessus TaxID=36809 RepID=UPI000926F29C|nr:hypothetical protein [Mycobacteroides abscessus]MBN7481015.1 hypothetical protein [Mycobacteroides abscessus subsp. massiliense]MDM2175295.1 hypothetical protein [Mycobacteroides abscessus]MDM2176319.1 hypothetical protein [Mycobacteroides abscessus]MDM2204884.1 hypothetical protein [Mycobacteroides abscessus]MDM2210469.1 hypothetical protein [Mycobacteroides abscessus]
MSQPEQSFDHDLDALLRCVDMCTSRALEALEDDGDVGEAQQWVVRIRKSVFDFMIRNAPDADDDD